MRLFRHENRDRNEDTRRIYAAFELVHTFVDFSAAVCFTIGSVLFFWDSTQTPATWLFLIGSILFAAKPSLRLAREIKLARMGELDKLAKRAEA
ncbi:YrhK family protein [Pseudoruegeria sp. HB172150]|uniref:YrhK family protein n=1 Tax=Pseudoruegeria sp. HB172150 TaxID=2721164 RepID=UPI001555AF7D|nr:YrhK family protein [Pseudoruegeria sp. HB172150]